MTQQITERDAILAAIAAHVAQRSGIDGRNYGGDRDAFLGDYRPMLQHGRDARAMLAQIRWRDSIDAAALKEALRSAFSGRLSWDSEKQRLDYTTGQYFPTEYRRAACAVLAGALWRYWAENAKDADAIRKTARRELGRGIASRWFR